MKVVLLGMNNPLSERPGMALWPDPPGCTGWRIWKMLNDARPDVSPSMYRTGFERRNMLDSKEWDRSAAQAYSNTLRIGLRGREVVVFGEEVRRVVGLAKVIIHPQTVEGVVWRCLPHPSGRCLWYNDPACRMLAGLLLAEMYERGR